MFLLYKRVIHINNQRINYLEFLGNARLHSVVVSNNKSQLEKRGDLEAKTRTSVKQGCISVEIPQM